MQMEACQIDECSTHRAIVPDAMSNHLGDVSTTLKMVMTAAMAMAAAMAAADDVPIMRQRTLLLPAVALRAVDALL